MSKTPRDVINCDLTLIMALKDTLNVVSGKWKLAIVCTLLTGKKRFSEIQRNIADITPRMISKELRELELNGVVTRRVINSTPVLIEYELSASGKLLNDVVVAMVEWGVQHRADALADADVISPAVTMRQ
jgi:DNA-binding HxlR family transcriptional regulator